MRWDLVLAVVVSALGAFWWKFIRVPTALAAIRARVPLSVTFGQLMDGSFLTCQRTEERRRLTAGAPMSLQWAFGWIVHVHDVDIALDIVRHSPSVWQQIELPSAPWSLVRQLWGTGLPVSNNPHWKLHRTIASHAFSNDSLRHIHELSFVPTAKQLADKWQRAHAAAASATPAAGPATVDVTEDLGAFNLRALGRAAFGFEFGDDSACALMNTVVDQILQPSRYMPGSLYDLLPVRDNAIAKDALARVNAIVHSLIRHRREFHKKRDEQKQQRDAALERGAIDVQTAALAAAAAAAEKPVLIDHLLSGTDEHGTRLSDDEVRDEAFVFFIAGLDTSQLSLSTTMWFLAHNPNAQRICYEEVVRVCGEHIVSDPAWAGPSYEDVKKMHFMLACVWEAIRLYRLTQPVRANNAPAKVGGVEVPTGTMVIIDAWSMHRNEKYWGDNADRFHPERWLDGYESGDDGIDSTPRFRPNKQSFFAFGGSGPRSCIGQNFSVGWQRVALSILLTRFVFSPSDPLHTQVLNDGKSSDMKFYSKGLFSVPITQLHITPRPAFGQSPSPRLQPAQPQAHAHVPPLQSAAAAADADAKARS